MDLVPGSIQSEPVMPLPDCLPRTELRRMITPRSPGPIPPDDRLNHAAVLSERTTTLPRGSRHQRLDQSPGIIRDRLRTRHPTRTFTANTFPKYRVETRDRPGNNKGGTPGFPVIPPLDGGAQGGS